MRRTMGDEIVPIEGSRKEELLRAYAKAARMDPAGVLGDASYYKVSEFGDGLYR